MITAARCQDETNLSESRNRAPTSSVECLDGDVMKERTRHAIMWRQTESRAMDVLSRLDRGCCAADWELCRSSGVHNNEPFSANQVPPYLCHAARRCAWRRVGCLSLTILGCLPWGLTEWSAGSSRLLPNSPKTFRSRNRNLHRSPSSDISVHASSAVYTKAFSNMKS